MEIEQQREVFVNRADSSEHTLHRSSLENNEAVIADFLTVKLL